MAGPSEFLCALQPAPGDTATLLHPKYQVSSCEAHLNNGGSPALQASGLEHAVAAARAFNQVEAAASGFSGRSDDSAQGERSHVYAHPLLDAQSPISQKMPRSTPGILHLTAQVQENVIHCNSVALYPCNVKRRASQQG